MATQQMICASSSSSSSSLVSLKKYDIFLSFRGEDTRRNFTSHLYDALIRKKIITFIDDNELQKGDSISPRLTKAIEESYISIVIFSEDYASSKWCLNELIKILECKNDWGQIVIPVFYNIDPSHIRKQTGSYQRAFAKHKRDMKLNKDMLQKWKVALFEASNLVGFDSSKYRNESEVIKIIVKDVLRKLKPRYPFEVKERGLVGIEQKYEEMKSLLEMGSNDVRFLGVWGMGGIGKTTLVEVLIAKLHSHFEDYCFLKNVREQSQKYGLDAVRNKLFSALLEEENLRFDAPCIETQSIMRRLLCKKLLIVLDDVTTSKQIMECLVIDNNYLGPGSRVIVTTRDRQIISRFHAKYEVKELNKCDSVELFCLNAFGEKHPKIGYEELSESAISYCKDNPLALKVLGVRLGSRSSKMAWESDLKKLQSTSDGEIHDVLKLSYDDLEPTEKDIFLDIACFFKGWAKFFVIPVLEGCDFFPAIGVEVLLDKALITIPGHRIEMHDLIQEMGRKIVNQTKEPGERSRLWKAEEVADVLKNNTGTKGVQGIRLDTRELVEDLSLSSDCFKRVTNLRHLSIDGSYECKVYLPDGLEWLSDKLRYLGWGRFPLESLPSTFCAKMLVVLYMPESKIKKLWDGVQNLFNLKLIDISHSKDFIEMPDLSRATNLERVDLEYCSSLCELHPSVLSLPKLNELHLRGCTKIKSLKSNIHSKSLRILDLESCSSLAEFSVTSEEMTKLSLKSTAIRELTSSIWRNSKLEVLELAGCRMLSIVGKKLIDHLGIVSVTVLDLSKCTQMDALNLSFLLDGIQSLKELILNECCNLETLPHNIDKHTELTRLSLAFSGIRELPSSIWRNSKLEDLVLMGCEKLSIVGKKLSNDPGIGSVRSLDLTCCRQIDALNLSFLLDGIQPSLKELCLGGCCNLESLPHNIHKHTELKTLDLDGCIKLVLPSSSTDLLPPSLQQLIAANYTERHIAERLDLDGFIKLVENNWRNGDLVKEYPLLMPEYQFRDTFGFQGGNSIIIPHIPKSNLKGFLVCLLLSMEMQFFPQNDPYFFIYDHGEQVGKEPLYIYAFQDKVFLSDHVFLRFYDYKRIRIRESEGDHYNNLEFKFQCCDFMVDEEEWRTDGIKGCRVLPVYDDLELDDKSSSNHRVEIIELESSNDEASDVDEFEAGAAIRDDDQQQPSYYPKEDEQNFNDKSSSHCSIVVEIESSTAQACDVDEFEARAIGDDDQQQSSDYPKEDEENFNEKSSCDCSIGLLLKHLVGESNRMFLQFFKHNKTTS